MLKIFLEVFGKLSILDICNTYYFLRTLNLN